MTEYNKVVYDGQTLIDLTQDDVTASDVRNGVYFHSADGVRGQGTLTSTSIPTADTIAEWDNDVHMNSEDMTSQEVEDFVDGLNVSGTSYFKVESMGYQLANGNVMTYLGGKLKYFELPDGKCLAYFSCGVSTTTARTDSAVIRFTDKDGYVLEFDAPYYFIAEISNTMRFSYGNNDGYWLNAPGTWNANTNWRVSGSAIMNKTNTHI